MISTLKHSANINIQKSHIAKLKLSLRLENNLNGRQLNSICWWSVNIKAGTFAHCLLKTAMKNTKFNKSEQLLTDTSAPTIEVLCYSPSRFVLIKPFIREINAKGPVNFTFDQFTVTFYSMSGSKWKMIYPAMVKRHWKLCDVCISSLDLHCAENIISTIA